MALPLRLTLFFVFYVSILLFKIVNIPLATQILIPLFVYLIFVNNYLNNKPVTSKNVFLIIAFLFVCVGDTLVNLTKIGQYAVIAFAFTHICLSIYYLKDNPFKKRDLILLLPVVVVSVTIYLLILDDMHLITQRIVFAVYLLILSTMLWRSISYLHAETSKNSKILIITGSLLFYCTDVFVSVNVLYNLQLFVILTWICYPPALFGLSMINYQRVKLS